MYAADAFDGASRVTRLWIMNENEITLTSEAETRA